MKFKIKFRKPIRLPKPRLRMRWWPIPYWPEKLVCKYIFKFSVEEFVDKRNWRSEPVVDPEDLFGPEFKFLADNLGFTSDYYYYATKRFYPIAVMWYFVHRVYREFMRKLKHIGFLDIGEHEEIGWWAWRWDFWNSRFPQFKRKLKQRIRDQQEEEKRERDGTIF